MHAGCGGYCLTGRRNQKTSEHNCLDIIEYQTKVMPDLSEVLMHDGAKLFIDGSSQVIERKRHNWYAIINEPNIPCVREVDYLIAG